MTAQTPWFHSAVSRVDSVAREPVRKTAWHRTVLVGLCLIFVACSAMAAEKPSVLYVGTDPAKGPPAEELQIAPNPARLRQLYAGRMPAFKALLQQYFDKVRVIDASQYTPQMSDHYDVTVFDALPPALPLAKGRINKRTGQPMKAYLPRNFSKPAILIGVNGYYIGAFLGLKINLHCPCLDAQAHGMKLNHPIFNAPLKVHLTIQQVKTPENYFPYYSGRNLGPTLPMWRVQSEGWMDGKGFPVGLVSTGPGFEDSPDAEVISNGVNSKAVNSVAIARHGNFFMWGFWGDPSYMTEEAREVFVNSIYYISKFNGQAPFVRVDGYKMSRDFFIDDISAIAKGDLHKRYHQQLSFPAPYATHDETAFLANLFQVPPSVAGRFGFNGNAYVEYQLKQVEYLRAVPGKFFQYAVDPDARELGISNRDIRLLDKCVSMLERGDRPDLARRLLHRYTEENFTTAAEWRRWLEANRKKIFFTDLGGFHFLVYPR